MKTGPHIFLTMILASCLASACQPAGPISPPTLSPLIITPLVLPTNTALQVTATPQSTATPVPLVPNFEHIVIFIFENKEFGYVIGNYDMPYYNLLATSYTLLTQYYAPTHPSLPNYLALIGGDTFNHTFDCNDCYVNAPSLPDLIEQSGRTWKTYQDDMPEPCYLGDTLRYLQKHNPFIYFDAIRLDEERCKRSIVPLTQLDADIVAGDLPNFIFITPDICYSGHDCALNYTDGWVKEYIQKIFPPLDAEGKPYLIILTWDEGQGDHGCCGLPEVAGGRVATVLISPQVKQGFQDATPYTHYSLLKTISQAWGLSFLGHAADDQNVLITDPWK